MTLKQIYQKLPDEQACTRLLKSIMWDNIPKCPYCGSIKSVKLTDEDRYHCNNCNTSYSVTAKTIFHKTKIPLQKWFYIICLKEEGGLNMSLRDLGIQLNTTKDTANRIINKVNNFYSQNIKLFNSIYSIITKK